MGNGDYRVERKLLKNIFGEVVEAKFTNKVLSYRLIYDNISIVCVEESDGITGSPFDLVHGSREWIENYAVTNGLKCKHNTVLGTRNVDLPDIDKVWVEFGGDKEHLEE